MKTCLGVSVLITSLALAGCGSGPIMMMADDGADESGAEDPSGEDEAGETDGEPEPQSCFDDDGTLLLGALRLESDPERAWMIDGGIERELELDGSGELMSLLGGVAGEHIVVARNNGTYSEPNTDIHLFARSSGERQWVRSFEGVAVSRLWVADDGLLAASTSSPVPVWGFVMSGPDVIATLTGHEPLAAPALDHVAVVEIGPTGVRGTPGWISLDDQSFTAVSLPPLATYDLRVGDDDHTLEYVALVDGQPAYVQATPGHSESIPLPLELLDSQSLAITASAAEYRVVRRYDGNDQHIIHVRVDLAAELAELVDPLPPPGWSFFDCYNRNAAVDGDGRLYFELRDDSSARTWIHELDTQTWTPAGHELGLVDDMDIRPVSNDVLIVQGMAQFNTYCPSNEWGATPEDALIGDSFQLIRREPAVNLVLPYSGWQVEVDAGQRCVASVGEQGWEVRGLDGSDTLLELGDGSGPSTWLWLP